MPEYGVEATTHPNRFGAFERNDPFRLSGSTDWQRTGKRVGHFSPHDLQSTPRAGIGEGSVPLNSSQRAAGHRRTATTFCIGGLTAGSDRGAKKTASAPHCPRVCITKCCVRPEGIRGISIPPWGLISKSRCPTASASVGPPAGTWTGGPAPSGATFTNCGPLTRSDPCVGRHRFGRSPYSTSNSSPVSSTAPGRQRGANGFGATMISIFR